MPEQFPNRLKRLMFERGIDSAAELGRRIGVTGQTVTRWLAGTSITEQHLRALAEELRVNWLWLGYGDEATPRTSTAFGELQQKALRRAHDTARRLRVAQDVSGFGAWEVDVVSGKLTWDEQTCRLFQLDQAHAPKTPDEFFKIIWQEDLPALLEQFDQMMLDATLFEAEYRYTRPDGQVRWFRERARALYDDAGLPYQVVGACMDVTDEKHARDLAARYERIRDLMLDTYAEVCVDGTILDVTEGCLKYGGWSRAELVGKNIRDFYADPKQREALVRALIEHGEVFNFPATLKCKGERTIDILYNARLVVGEDGEPGFIAGTLRPAHPTDLPPNNTRAQYPAGN